MAGATGRPRGRPRKTQVAGLATATAQISSFARVSKQSTAPGKDLADTNTAKPFQPTTANASARKRKAARSPEPEEASSFPTARCEIVPPPTSRSSKKARRQTTASKPAVQTQEQTETPATPRAGPTRKRALSPSVEESPRTREAGNLFKRLRIDASPFSSAATRRPSPLVTTTAAVTHPSTPATSTAPDSDGEGEADTSNATTPEPDDVVLPPLPQELLDVVSLYAALLGTLSVHYAQNGTSAPVDLRQISQAVSLAWGRRRITLADVRRCVGVMDATGSSPFSLVDYGNKKICIELVEGSRNSPLDEARLAGVFEGNLRDIWKGVGDAAEGEDPGALVLSLPKAGVHSCESVVRASPLLARGQRAMAELRKGIEARKDEKEAARIVNDSAANSDGTAPGQKLSLLERLRLKEAQLAQLAATGPTPAELERRAALQRAGDIAAVIAMLAKSAPAAGMGGRVSFTMAIVLQKLKDSLRLPISKEEGAACVRLLSGEVAPEWLKIVKIGAKENVVITVGRAPSSAAVAERVKVLSA